MRIMYNFRVRTTDYGPINCGNTLKLHKISDVEVNQMKCRKTDAVFTAKIQVNGDDSPQRAFNDYNIYRK